MWKWNALHGGNHGGRSNIITRAQPYPHFPKIYPHPPHVQTVKGRIDMPIHGISRC